MSSTRPAPTNSPPPPPGASPAPLWGDEDHVRALFGGGLGEGDVVEPHLHRIEDRLEALETLGKRRLAVPPVFTNLASEPARLLRLWDLPPEALDGLPLSARSDLFSLGAVLWELLTLGDLVMVEDGYENGGFAVTITSRSKPMPVSMPKVSNFFNLASPLSNFSLDPSQKYSLKTIFQTSTSSPT